MDRSRQVTRAEFKYIGDLIAEGIEYREDRGKRVDDEKIEFIMQKIAYILVE